MTVEWRAYQKRGEGGKENLVVELEGAEGRRNMEIGLGRKGGAPSRVETRLGVTFNAIKIGAPRMLGVELIGEGFHGNGEFSGPRFVFFVHDDAPT